MKERMIYSKLQNQDFDRKNGDIYSDLMACNIPTSFFDGLPTKMWLKFELIVSYRVAPPAFNIFTIFSFSSVVKPQINICKMQKKMLFSIQKNESSVGKGQTYIASIKKSASPFCYLHVKLLKCSFVRQILIFISCIVALAFAATQTNLRCNA